jgi:hypothetical protein
VVSCVRRAHRFGAQRLACGHRSAVARREKPRVTRRARSKAKPRWLRDAAPAKPTQKVVCGFAAFLSPRKITRRQKMRSARVSGSPRAGSVSPVRVRARRAAFAAGAARPWSLRAGAAAKRSAPRRCLARALRSHGSPRGSRRSDRPRCGSRLSLRAPALVPRNPNPRGQRHSKNKPRPRRAQKKGLSPLSWQQPNANQFGLDRSRASAAILRVPAAAVTRTDGEHSPTRRHSATHAKDPQDFAARA